MLSGYIKNVMAILVTLLIVIIRNGHNSYKKANIILYIIIVRYFFIHWYACFSCQGWFPAN